MLLKECDDHVAILGRGRILVPNSFILLLPEPSYSDLCGHSGQLEKYLANRVRRHAAEQHYSFVGRVTVELRPSSKTNAAKYQITSHVAPIRVHSTGYVVGHA
ncbi:hypothetical protein STSP_37350 [Streptomyces jeddahensis]|uniref:FhaA N-terminal domain-containing protein n=2 Tax=Streptomyces jeddahensis TaxID=1716141 RepID=A0A177HSE6_9ACTN|nr:hypothetical protein STSP_37350 [Streptomyces jeddahensis]